MSNIYNEYKNTKEWEIVEKAITELIKNNDLQLTTAVDYIVGYIAKQLIDSKDKKGINQYNTSN